MRKFLVYTLGFLFSVFLSVFLLVFVLTSTIGNGERVKSWFESADTVNLTVRNALFLAEGAELSDEVKKDVGERLVEPVGENLLTPQLNSAIDQTYAWLNADEYQTLKVNLDFSSNNREIKAAINELINEHFDELPKCNPSDRDEDERFCVEGVEQGDRSRFADELFKELSGKDGILKETTFKADDKDADSTLQTIHGANKVLRSMLIWLPLFMGLMLAAAVLLMDKDHFASGRIFARYVIGSLALPVILSLLLFFILPREFNVNTDLESPESTAALGDIVSPLIRTIIFSMTKTYLLIALPLLTSAIVAVVMLKRREKKLPGNEKSSPKRA